MRFLEILILPLTLIALLAACLPPRPSLRALRFLPGVIVVLILVHWIAEGYRWQMAPAYALAFALFLIGLPGLLKKAGATARRGIGTVLAGAFGLLVWLVAAALPTILPVPQLPTPPGPYAVGSIVYDWTDSARPETYTADPNDRREIMVQIWYPAQPASGAKTISFVDHADVALPAFAKYLGLPPFASFALDHLRLVGTHAYPDAPIRADGWPYPVVIYSHGYTGYRTASTNQMEALASAGYIAVAIDHPYGAAFTVFADGRVALNTPDVLSPRDTKASEKLEAVFVADQRFVLDQLERLNAGQLDPRFTGKIDLQRIGLTGVSTGGGAIVWACHLDPRCKAGLVQDGWYEPIPANIITEPTRQPFMFLQSETDMWTGDNLARLDRLFKGVAAPAYHLKLAGVLHNDFGDYPLLSPLNAMLPARGGLEGKRTVQVIDAYILAFFDTYLKGRPAPLLKGPLPEYREVTFESRAP